MSRPDPGRPEAWNAFTLDPRVHPLNHGSFGAVTRAVQAKQAALRSEMEADTMAFFLRRVLPGLERARAALAAFVGAREEDLVFVRNATEGVATIFDAIRLGPGDQIVVNDHEYRACVNAACAQGAEVSTVEIPLPSAGPDAVMERLMSAVTPRTRAVLLSHVTSPTGLVFPMEAALDALAPRGIELVVDGAHAPGMLPIELERWAARGLRFYTANLHKWVGAPKGTAFLWVHPDAHRATRPRVVSHGYGHTWPGRNRLQTAFDWTGTDDPTGRMVLADALEALDALHPDGLPGLRARNRALAIEARRLLDARLGSRPLAPESMLGWMAAVALPDDPGPPRAHALAMPELQARLHERGFRVPISSWPAHPRRLIRISVHAYNHRAEYEALAGALEALLSAEDRASGVDV